MRTPRATNPLMLAAALAALTALALAVRAQDTSRPAAAKRDGPCPAAAPASRPVTIPRAEQFEMRSAAGLNYTIFVAAPTLAVPDSGSPVIYLTDGNGDFPVVVAAARRQSLRGTSAVVVGIGYPGDDAEAHRRRRAFDLTPPMTAKAAAAAAGKLPGGSYASQTGGNEQFLKFIESELKPEIERRYRIDRRKQTLFGHSFGGLFVLHVLFSRPAAFQTYLINSPSIFWNEGSILQAEKGFAARYAEADVDARVLITVGGLELAPRRGHAEGRERLAAFGTAKDLARRLEGSKIKGLTVQYREFPEEDHGSVLLPAASRGVRFALEAP